VAFEIITFATEGNAVLWGDGRIGSNSYYSVTCSNDVRHLVFTGYDGAVYIKDVFYFIPTSAGEWFDFGDMGNPGIFNGGHATANPTQAFCGNSNAFQVWSLITMAGQPEWNDLKRSSGAGGWRAISSPTTALLAGGSSDDVDQYVYSSGGRIIEWQETMLTDVTTDAGASGSHTRAILSGGGTNELYCEYFEMHTKGVSTYFGDLTVARNDSAAASDVHGGLSQNYNSTNQLAVWGGGFYGTGTNAPDSVTMESLVIPTRGEVASFGTLTVERVYKPVSVSSSTRMVT